MMKSLSIIRRDIMSKETKIKEIAAALNASEKSATAIKAISGDNPDLNISDAYKIQLLNIDKALSEGKRITGKKIGLTSWAMQNLLKVDQPDFGHLLNSMEVRNNTIERKKMVAPKVEAEIVFVLKEDIKGPFATASDVIAATDYVVAALEVVDSRFADWKINIVDTVADNASSGMYVISSKRIDPRKIDLKSVTMDFYKNGTKVNGGKGEDVLGDPAFAVAWLANTLSEFNVVLKKGEVVLSGALSAALPAEAGDTFKATFSSLGDIEVSFK
jgi:2-keto-4-pentenoate hydratase